VTCGERSFTYAELDAEVTRVASGFRNLGLIPGDRLAYQLRNDCPGAIVTLFAAALITSLTIASASAQNAGRAPATPPQPGTWPEGLLHRQPQEAHDAAERGKAGAEGQRDGCAVVAGKRKAEGG